MRYLIGIFTLVTMMAGGWGGSFYDFSFTGLDGATIATSAYKGKKVLVFAFNGSRPDMAMLHTLDSIQQVGADSLQVLAFPALELDSTVDNRRLKRLHDSLALTLTIAQPVKVQKGSGAAQAPLFQWLTSSDGNGHFSRDVEEEGMLFIIGRDGNLYSVINRGLYGRVLPRELPRAGN